MSKMWPPSFSPSTRNSPSPPFCGARLAMSSPVPSSPSGPTCTTRTVICWPMPSMPRQPQRVVTGRFVRRAGDAVESGRKLDCAGHVAQHQRRAIRRGVRHHQHDGEELVQEGDVAGNEDDPGDRRNAEQRIVAVLEHREERQRRDREVEARTIELRWERRLGAGELLIDDAQLLNDRFAARLRVEELARRQRRRQLNRERRAVDVERDLEVDGLEVVLVDDDPFLLDLIERQRP